jgi:dephospho-CoA kinase
LAKRVIVLTGGIGSGKSLAADHFAAKGITVVDADALSRQLTAPGGAALAAIRSALGPQWFAQDGGLDRDRVRALVFADPSARRQLEAILHPMIRRAAQVALALAPDPYAIYMVPLWIETHRSPTQPGPTEEPVEGVIVVDCAQETQIQRVMQRSGLTREDVLAIMATQASREERREKATHLLNNDGGIEQLAQQVDALHEQLIHS